MQRTANVREALVGKDVLAVLALLLLASGMTATASVPIEVGITLAEAVHQVLPVVDGPVFDLFVAAVVYVEAMVLAATYRAGRGAYRTLQQRAERVNSA